MIDRAPTRAEAASPRRSRGRRPDRDAHAASRRARCTSLRDALERCRECPIGEHATQAVPGEGPTRARLMFVGEQPGDQEDLQGTPLRRPGRAAVRARPRRARRGARRRLHHQRRQALQVRAARQAPHPQDAGAAGGGGLPALARERDRAGRARGAGRARRDGGAPADGPRRRRHARARPLARARRRPEGADHAAPFGAAAHGSGRQGRGLPRLARTTCAARPASHRPTRPSGAFRQRRHRALGTLAASSRQRCKDLTATTTIRSGRASIEPCAMRMRTSRESRRIDP